MMILDSGLLFLGHPVYGSRVGHGSIFADPIQSKNSCNLS